MAWIECVPYISEGRRRNVIERIARAIRSVPGVDLRSVHSDPDHNSSVFSFVGSPAAVSEGAFRCVAEAKESIDIAKHVGVHSPFGVADVVPLVPLAGTKLKHCGTWARALAERIDRELEIPVYRFGAASEEGTTLAALRKQIDRTHPTAGAVAVGARDLLIAFNVMLDTEDLEIAKRIAAAVCESGGGLAAVEALAFPLASRDCVQVAMSLTDYRKTSPLRAFRQVRRLAREAGVDVTGSEFVGMIPQDAVTRTVRSALRCGAVEVLDPEPGFLDRVAAREPVPAGGSAAAYTGALGAALVVMSCDASSPSARLTELRNKADQLRADLTELVELDVAAFRRVLSERTEDALKEATEIPVRIAEHAAELWAISAAAAHHCDDKVATDCAGGRRLAEAARDMAAETARANLPKIQDGTFRSRIARRLATAFSG